MANKEHLAVLKRGVSAWNEWRDKHPEIRPDLAGADLDQELLYHVDFSHADLRGTSLRGAQLRDADLTKAKLQGAELDNAQLQGAVLDKADLQGACLSGADLHKAHVLDTVLREADLQNATLTEVTGLLPAQLAGANVTDARLPEGIGKFDELTNVRELSDSAQKLFLSILAGCVYSWLTIATTTDVRLLPNSASSPLPIIQTEIPIAYFYWVAPFLLVCLYGYFHLYLQRLWEGLADLPALFPDGRSLDKVASSWLLNGLVCAHFKLLKPNRPVLSHLQVWNSLILAWWAVPATVGVFWLRYLRRHDWTGTTIHIVLLVAAFWSGIVLQRLAAATLRGEKRRPFLWRPVLQDGRAYPRCAVAVGVILTGLIFYLLSVGPIEGDPFSQEKERAKYSMQEDTFKNGYRINIIPAFIKKRSRDKLDTGSLYLWMPNFFAFFGYSTSANLIEADVSTKPEKWTGDQEKAKEEMALVKGAHLQQANLRYASSLSV